MMTSSSPRPVSMPGHTLHLVTGMCGLAGGLLFLAGDMLMYGHFGAAADFATGMRAAVTQMSLIRLYAGGLIGPLAACLCALGFWHIYQNVTAGMIRRWILALGLCAMGVLGAVHILWVGKGLVIRHCPTPTPACTALASDINEYWTMAYWLGVGPAYLACGLLAIMVAAGRSSYPRWTILFNPALLLLAAPALAQVPAPWGAVLVGGDANLFIALFFLVSVMTARPATATPDAAAR